MKTVRCFALACGLVFAGASVAQSLADDPGFVDFEPVTALVGQPPKVNVNFGPAMLAVLTETLRQSDPEVSELVANLKSLRVMIYEEVDGARMEEFARSMAGELGGVGWEPALTVRDEGTAVDLFLRSSEGQIRGLTMMVVESAGTAVFINIVGGLDPAGLGRLIGGTGLNLGALGALTGQLQVSEP